MINVYMPLKISEFFSIFFFHFHKLCFAPSNELQTLRIYCLVIGGVHLKTLIERAQKISCSSSKVNIAHSAPPHNWLCRVRNINKCTAYSIEEGERLSNVFCCCRFISINLSRLYSIWIVFVVVSCGERCG